MGGNSLHRWTVFLHVSMFRFARGNPSTSHLNDSVYHSSLVLYPNIVRVSARVSHRLAARAATAA